MAWRIADYIERGEIDNRTRDRVRGQLWLHGVEQPIQLELAGNSHRDLAGQLLRLKNPKSQALPPHLRGFASEQMGVVGDMTASRKVKILDLVDGDLEYYYTNKIKMPYHWANSLYLEWHSALNGRVVIESADYLLEVASEPSWSMSEGEETEQISANARAMTNFMNLVVDAAAQVEREESEDGIPESEQSTVEAEARAEHARMVLLMDRVAARLEMESEVDADMLARILQEERERMRRERGEPESAPLSEEQAAERDAWIEEMNAAMEETQSEFLDSDTLRTHPLVEHCEAFTHRIHDEIELQKWLPQDASPEHPINELLHRLWMATAKLSGAMSGEWPPELEMAGHRLIYFEEARSYLEDSLEALESIEAGKLTDPKWCPPLRQEINSILKQVQQMIDHVRVLLRGDEGDT